MASYDHEPYFSRREKHCRALAETHSDPFLRRIYFKFAENYAKALRDKDQYRPAPRPDANGNSAVTSTARKPEHPAA